MSQEQFVGRPNPMLWQGEQDAQGAFVGAVDDGFRVLEMPQATRRRRMALDQGEELSSQGRALLEKAIADLRAAALDQKSRRLSLHQLSERDLAILNDLWGEGEVSISAEGATRFLATESVFPGLWRVETQGQDGEPGSEWLEVAQVPDFVRRLADQVRRTDLDLSELHGQQTMNAIPVLAELRARARAWQGGSDAPNHVVNFSLLPLTPADSALIVRMLGQSGVRIRSEGYGSCRIILTGLRRVWSVQFMNQMGTVILDTLEVGDVPSVALAAREDFEDSAQRLCELREAYLS